MRLFTALWLPPVPSGHLEAAIDELGPRRVEEAAAGVRGFRFLPARQWHLTLCFHGEVADPEPLGTRLGRRVRRLNGHDTEFAAPRLRLAGTGSFRGVLWIGVEPEAESDAAALRSLARAAGADPHSYRAHLTVARWNRGRASEALRGLFAGYAGPRWRVEEIALVRSEPGRGPPVYSTTHRVPV
ncbi:RNA 2',3'-cyclic phosphodiesterase [Parasphingorhabdus pacifica]